MNWFFKSTPTYKYISFDNIVKIVNTNNNYKSVLLINTMNILEQSILIKLTTIATDEEHEIEKLIDIGDFYHTIFIYGKNNLDISVNNKYDQLIGLGFINVYIYGAGMFEWLLLRDIYGDDNFPITTTQPNNTFNILTYKSTLTLIN